ncbi:hypothetical protein ACGGZK_03875 [Agromyces sp. MMS24-K17]|uniref:hypothetical protein n=1 Tax=Agromyces sp. MMS24-K17 TaxID=3372850 RepID=UPI003754DE9C
MTDLPEHVVIGGTTFSRVESDDSIACWASILDDTRSVFLLVEPAAVPGPAQLRLAGTVVSRFGELAEVAAEYLRHRLREPRFDLPPAELSALDAPEAPFSEPEAVVWADGTWLLRFTESSLLMADPFGVGVVFEGTTPRNVEDLSDADLA